jgi:hypothetical protein
MPSHREDSSVKPWDESDYRKDKINLSPILLLIGRRYIPGSLIMALRKALKDAKISISLGSASLALGVLCWNLWTSSNTPDEIVMVERAIQEASTKRGEALNPTSRFAYPRLEVADERMWKALESSWSHLSPTNMTIAKAKVMLQVEHDPSDHDAGIWNNRHDLSARSLEIKRHSQLFLETVTVGALVMAGTFIGTFSALWLLGWSWVFLLERIRELSKAVRGQ